MCPNQMPQPGSKRKPIAYVTPRMMPPANVP